MTGPSCHLETAETGAFFREEFSKRGAVNTKNVPLCLCLSVLCPLFFPSGYIYCFFTQSLFIKSLPPHLCVLFISSSSGQNRADIFHIFSPRVVPALDKRASSVPGITLSDNLITFSSLINISGDTPPPVGPWFSCRALWVRTQPDFPLGMMSFQFGCVSRERKGAEKKGKKKNTVSKNRTMECKLTGMKSIRRGGKCVSSYLLPVWADWRVREGVCCRDWKSSQTVSQRSRLWLLTTTLKTSLWPGDMERRRASVGLIKGSNGYNRNYCSQRPH